MLGAHRPPSPLTGLEYSQVQLCFANSCFAKFNIETYLQADMALSALYLHNVNHRAAARPSLGQLSGYTFQVGSHNWKICRN